MTGSWLLLAAYACSGLAGLVYEVSWTRLATLYMGHTTAAASTVVAAFMGGLAGGSAIGGYVATRLTPRRALLAYVGLEAIVIVAALLLPWELTTLTPFLKWSYSNGAPGSCFRRFDWRRVWRCSQSPRSQWVRPFPWRSDGT